MHSPNRVGFARGNVPTFMDPEWQANVFAGELMAPYDLVKNMSAYEISQKCGMSLQAAQVQYEFYHKAMQMAKASFIHRKNQAHKMLGSC